MNGKIFIIEDEPSIIQLVQHNLEKNGFIVSSSLNGNDGLKELKKFQPDLLLLDWMLPDLSGIEICKNIRKDNSFKNLPVIMLTAKGEEVDRVLGFELGADDYVVKPFSVRELALRVSTVLKRKEKQQETTKISLGDIEINLSTYRVFISSTEIQLTAKEFLLFKHLVQKNGRIQPREVLLEEVWGYNSSVTTRTVDTHVKRLRSKIGDIGTKIETVRGVGYRFNYVV